MTRSLSVFAATAFLASTTVAGAQETPAAGTTARSPSAAEPAAAPAQIAPPTPTARAVKPPTAFGYVNFQYGRTDAIAPLRDTSTLELRRARIGVRGDLVPQLGYVVLWDGADTALKDAYGAVKNVGLLPGLEIRAGQWKTPFGYEQPESDTRLLWVNNSLVVQNLARGSDSRDLGVGVVGKWPVAGGFTSELAASVVNGAGPNRRDDLEEKNFWGRAGVAKKLGVATLRAGGSYGYGRQVTALGANARFDSGGATNGGVVQTVNDDTYLWFQTYGGDVTLDSPWLFVAAELIQSERTLLAFTSPSAAARTSFVARGWYAGLYGKTPWNIGPVLRVEGFDRNREVSDNSNERYTVGAYADLVAVNARLIFNYELDESARTVRTGNRAILFGQVVF